MECDSCEYYIPHSLYPYIGYCKKQEKVVFGMEGCSYFSEKKDERLKETFETLGWVYCVDCRRAIFGTEEAIEHMDKNHLLSVEFMPDQVAPEEVPAAD